MPEVLWSLYFIQAQGYGVKYVELHQDNISAQMLETNGKLSRSRKTKHIKAKFLFIKDKVDIEEVKIVDCPAGVMWADVLKKTTTGDGIQKNEVPVDELCHGVHRRGSSSSEGTQDTTWASISAICDPNSAGVCWVVS